jgi:hypothetical protein
VTYESLAAALLAQAQGSYAHEAAVWLLIEHRSWLQRQDFLRFVDVAPALAEERGLMASVDWDAAMAADLPASTSETQMLAVAAELAGVDTGRSLQDLLGGLDRANVTLVMRAVLHAHRGGEASPLTAAPFRADVLRAEVRAGRPGTAPPPSVGGGVEPEGPGL